MKKLILAISIFSFASISSFANVHVNGHYRSNGTYVQAHERSNPDGNPYNNWSATGNVNPNTGQLGTHNPYNQGYGR